MSDPQGELAQIADQAGNQTPALDGQGDPLVRRLNQVAPHHHQLTEEERRRLILEIDWSTVFEQTGPEEGVDLGSEIIEPPGLADPFFPNPIPFHQFWPGYFNALEVSLGDDLKRWAEVVEKVSQSSKTEEKEKD